MTSQEQARALRDALLKNMQGRKGFHRYHLDADTRNEWDEEWLAIITAALTQTTPQWTNEKPTESGLYWFKDGSAVTIVRVEIGLMDSFMVQRVEWLGSNKRPALHLVNGQFAGPLSPPEETAT